MKLALNRDSGTPLYRQIVQQTGDLIRAGRLQPGARLPSVRQLAAEYGLTRLTVHSAYEELQAQGLIESHVGRGTFVTQNADSQRNPDSAAQPPASWASHGVLAQLLRVNNQPDIVSFAEAMPDPTTYPLGEIGEAVRRVVQSDEVLSYGPIQGDAGLRGELSALLLHREVSISPEDMLVTAGAQQGVDLVLRGLLEPSDVVLVEEPTYPGFLEAAAQQRRRLVGIPRDGLGLDVEALEAACRTHRPALLYLIPTFGNPTGTSMPPEQRAAVLQLARTYDFLILEDDVYGFLAYDQPADPPLKSVDTDGRVIFITSLSKTLAPALRLGMVAASPSQLPLMAEAKQGADLVCSMLLQRTAAEYLHTGQMQSHLRSVRALYGERRDAMLAALEQHLSGCAWTHPTGGLSLWLTLPEGIDERDFIRDATDEGVGVAPGRAFVPRPSPRASMRISFGMQTPEKIDQGVSALGRVLRLRLGRHGAMSVAGRALGPLV